MLNEVQIAALETAAKVADEDESQCGDAGLYEDAETARRAAAWCRGRIEENTQDATRRGELPVPAREVAS